MAQTCCQKPAVSLSIGVEAEPAATAACPPPRNSKLESLVTPRSYKKHPGAV